MSFGQSVKTVFRNYATFTGRARRSEFWWFVLFSAIVSIVARVIDRNVFPGWGNSGPIGVVVSLALLLPTLAVTARRLHDRDQTGWWQLILFIPVIGHIVMIVKTVQPGTPGPNRFGPDPLGRNAGHGYPPAPGPQDRTPGQPGQDGPRYGA